MINKNNNLHSFNPRRRLLAAGAALPALARMDALPAQAKLPVVIGWLLICADEVIA